jgi:hypothetical protein
MEQHKNNKDNENLSKDIHQFLEESVAKDLTIPYASLISRATEKAFTVKVNSNSPKRIIPGTVNEVTDIILRFSAQARGKENVYKAAKKIMEDINYFSAKGMVTGCLAPLSYMTLQTQNFELEAYVVFCFISVPSDIDPKNIEDHMTYMTAEGGIGPVVL